MEDFKNILFINFGGIGDEILFLPAIKSVREEYKNAIITLALEPRAKCIKKLTDMINETICVDIKAPGIDKFLNILKFIFIARSKKFDCVISSGKSPFIAIILFLTGIKNRIGYNSKTDFLLTTKMPLKQNQYAAKMYHDLVKPVTLEEYQNPKIEITQNYELNERFKKGEYICIHPGVSLMSVSKKILKCPNITFWADLIKGLLLKNKQVVLLGGKDDKTLTNEILKDEEISQNPNFINHCNKTKDIMEMAFIIKNAASLICVDSAPLHVGVGVGVKTYAIFAPTNEEKLVPKDANVIVIKNDTDCRPCLWHKRNCSCKEPKCLNINPGLILDNIN